MYTVLEMKIWIYWSKSNSWIYFYKYLNKNWKIYRSEQSFAGVGPEDWCWSWGLYISMVYSVRVIVLLITPPQKILWLYYVVLLITPPQKILWLYYVVLLIIPPQKILWLYYVVLLIIPPQKILWLYYVVLLITPPQKILWLYYGIAVSLSSLFIDTMVSVW